MSLQPTFFAAVGVLVSFGSMLSAQAPIHRQIDQHIQAAWNKDVKPAAIADDAEFLRRIYLDLTGILPTPQESRDFFADGNKDKRALLIDRLLHSDGFCRQWASVLDVTFMDRRVDKYVKKPAWDRYLRASLASNKPYDQLVREILSADGADPKTRVQATFFLNREGEPNQITKDVARLFLGMNLQCAQCHDHPLVDAYKQDFYFGIYAFLNRSYLYTDKATKLATYAEKADGDVTFQSVFVAKVTKSTGPRLPEGKEFAEPKFEKGKEYTTAVKAGEAGVPKFSRRQLLAGAIASADNPRFARAAMNRLWATLLGRGIINPVEFDHPDNPPSHPELLDLLSKEFVKQKFDLKSMIRAIVLSDTYQRSSVLPKDVKDAEPKTFSVAALRPMSPEQFAWSILQGTGFIEAEKKAVAKFDEAALYGDLTEFAKLFGSSPGEPAVNQEFESTLDQTLFLANGTKLRTWLNPRPGNLLDRLKKLTDNDAVSEELYLSVLARLPDAGEKRLLDDFLKTWNGDRLAGLQELTWAMLTSAEFRFIH